MSDVFGGDQPQNTGTTLVELVGEGKKFKTVDDLVKGKLEADNFIEQLKGELKVVREEMAKVESEAAKKGTIEELLNTVRKANAQSEATGNAPITEDKLQEMVNSILDGRHDKQTRLANYQQANQAVLEKFNGDLEMSRTYIAERSKALGMSVDDLKALGERSPSAFKQLMGVEPTKQTVTQGVTGVQGAVIDRGANPHKPEVIDGKRTKAYYDRLKRELGPGRYWTDTKIQGQYLKDSMALGERFN